MDALAPKSESLFQVAWAQFRRHRLAVWGGRILLVLYHVPPDVRLQFLSFPAAPVFTTPYVCCSSELDMSIGIAVDEHEDLIYLTFGFSIAVTSWCH